MPPVRSQQHLGDVRGRQAAWLLIVGPFSTAETVLLTALSDRVDLWPWAIGCLIALLGGAAGLAPLASLISVQPPDEAGNPTPAWSLKVHLALVAVTLTAAPSLALLTAGAATHRPWLAWTAVPVAALTGALLLHRLGAAAARRLRTTQTTILYTLSAAS